MKGNNALQIIFAFFLGLVLVAFVGIGVNTFYPAPTYSAAGAPSFSSWQLVTSIILLIVATATLAISLALPANQAVITNGLLLGGVFTMVYAVIAAMSTDQNIWRFVVIAAALAVTILIGYLKFTHRGRQTSATPSVTALPADSDVRLAELERRFDALRKALND